MLVCGVFSCWAVLVCGVLDSLVGLCWSVVCLDSLVGLCWSVVCLDSLVGLCWSVVCLDFGMSD